MITYCSPSFLCPPGDRGFSFSGGFSERFSKFSRIFYLSPKYGPFCLSKPSPLFLGSNTAGYLVGKGVSRGGDDVKNNNKNIL